MRLRARLPEECLTWLDAAVALAGETLGFPPLLGSGGNNGNLDFSSNFMQRLADVIDPETGMSRAGARAPLESALFGNATTAAGEGAIGQFAPGAAGGPNSTAGFERGALINSWDYILMLEGALVFAASATRRLGAAADAGILSYPFTVRTTSAAGAGAAVLDEGDARGEIWLPLWDCSASLAEILALFSEGRATLGRRPAQDGLDFARAAATLGVNRGVAAFQRFGFLQRSGKAYVAAPMSRVRVQRNPRADLLNDLDPGAWLQSFRRYARGNDAPARLRSLALRLDEAIFAMTQDASPRAVQRVLIAVGEAAAYLVSSPKSRDPKEGKQKPPPRLRSAWFHAADDGSPEFRIAAALAGLGRPPANAGDAAVDAKSAIDDGAMMEEGEAPEDNSGSAESATPEEEQRGRAIPPPLRAHLAPLDEKSWYGWFRKWSDKGALAVWGDGALEPILPPSWSAACCWPRSAISTAGLSMRAHLRTFRACSPFLQATQTMRGSPRWRRVLPGPMRPTHSTARKEGPTGIHCRSPMRSEAVFRSKNTSPRISACPSRRSWSRACAQAMSARL